MSFILLLFSFISSSHAGILCQALFDSPNRVEMATSLDDQYLISIIKSKKFEHVDVVIRERDASDGQKKVSVFQDIKAPKILGIEPVRTENNQEAFFVVGAPFVDTYVRVGEEYVLKGRAVINEGIYYQLSPNKNFIAILSQRPNHERGTESFRPSYSYSIAVKSVEPQSQTRFFFNLPESMVSQIDQILVSDKGQLFVLIGDEVISEKNL